MAWSTDQLLLRVVCANSVSLRRNKHATKEEIGVAFDRFVMLNITISVDDEDETGMARPAAVMDAVLITLPATLRRLAGRHNNRVICRLVRPRIQ